MPPRSTLSGTMLKREPPLIDGHTDHGWRLHQIGAATDHCLQTQHDLRRCRHRIDGAPGIAAVALTTGDFDAQLVGARHCGTATIGEAAAWQIRTDVKCEHRIGLGTLQRTFLDHGACTPDFAGKSRIQAGAFLGRLKYELHRAGQLVLHGGEHFGGRH